MPNRMNKKKLMKRSKTGFQKVWFSDGREKTAGLILSADMLRKMSVSDISRLFPTSEGAKMKKLHVSPAFDTWDEAFKFSKDR